MELKVGSLVFSRILHSLYSLGLDCPFMPVNNYRVLDIPGGFLGRV